MSLLRHLGYNLGWLGNVEGYYAGEPYGYQDSSEHWDGLFYLHGVWLARPHELVHGRSTDIYDDYVDLRFTARRVSLTMGSRDSQPCRVRVMLDSKPIWSTVRGCDVRPERDGHTYVYVDTLRTYSLLVFENSSTHDFRLFSDSQKLSLSLFILDMG